MDHRRLQRALFRMQHDPAFAARLRAGDAEAAASTGLGEAELACLRGADPCAIAADREGRRAAQLLRNLASELRLATALGPAGDGRREWLAAFPGTPHFHRAVSEGTPLPLAFAAWAEARAAAAPCPAFRALVALEAALVRVRRAPVADAALPPPGTVVRAPTAHLLALPAGTHDAAAAVTEWLDGGGCTPAAVATDQRLDAGGSTPAAVATDQRLDSGGSTPAAVATDQWLDRSACAPLAPPPVDETEREVVLLAADPRADVRFGRLRPVRVEPLPPLVAELLRLAERPLARAARAAFADRHDVEHAAVEGVVAEYLAEGVLRGEA